MGLRPKRGPTRRRPAGAGCSIVAAVYPMAESLGKTLALRDVRVKKNGF
jgi:hypothetical protein